MSALMASGNFFLHLPPCNVSDVLVGKSKTHLWKDTIQLPPNLNEEKSDADTLQGT